MQRPPGSEPLSTNRNPYYAGLYIFMHYYIYLSHAGIAATLKHFKPYTACRFPTWHAWVNNRYWGINPTRILAANALNVGSNRCIWLVQHWFLLVLKILDDLRLLKKIFRKQVNGTSQNLPARWPWPHRLPLPPGVPTSLPIQEPLALGTQLRTSAWEERPQILTRIVWSRSSGRQGDNSGWN